MNFNLVGVRLPSVDAVGSPASPVAASPRCRVEAGVDPNSNDGARSDRSGTAA